jgi:uncharacterized RDD family membrane protein YckC
MPAMAAAANPTQVVGRRVLAFLIDFLITGVFYWGLFFLFAERYVAGTEPRSAFSAKLILGDSAWAISGGDALLFFGIFLAVGLLYWVVLQGLTGATLGKVVTGIRTVGRDFRRAGIGRALVRQLVGIVDYFPYFLPGLVGFILSLSTRGNRRLGDMAAGTYVVHRSALGQPAPAGVAPAAAAGAGPQSPGQPPASTPAGHVAPTATAEANWYPDPRGEARLRYWDGSSWTEHTSG